jgi:negative regulator of genetic competence, sporulation and motility
MSEREAYELYKKREIIENLSDSYKSTLYADRLYLHSDKNMFGHMFIAFRFIYAYCKIESILKKAKLNKTLMSVNLLFEFSKIYHIFVFFKSILNAGNLFERYSLKFS